MTEQSQVLIHCSHEPMSDGVRDFIEEQCQALLREFPELERIEVSLLPEGQGHSAHVHATGRRTNIAANHDWAREMGHAADLVLHKVAARLRRHHDRMRSKGRRGARGVSAAA